MAPFPDDGTAVRRALVVTAHPDDVDFGAAGTVAAWTAAGVEVVYCICTSGDAGGFDASSREQMSQTRQDEQRGIFTLYQYCSCRRKCETIPSISTISISITRHY